MLSRSFKSLEIFASANPPRKRKFSRLGGSDYVHDCILGQKAIRNELTRIYFWLNSYIKMLCICGGLFLFQVLQNNTDSNLLLVKIDDCLAHCTKLWGVVSFSQLGDNFSRSRLHSLHHLIGFTI